MADRDEACGHIEDAWLKVQRERMDAVGGQQQRMAVGPRNAGHAGADHATIPGAVLHQEGLAEGAHQPLRQKPGEVLRFAARSEGQHDTDFTVRIGLLRAGALADQQGTA